MPKLADVLPAEAKTIFDANPLDWSFCYAKERLARLYPFAVADVIWDDGSGLYLVNVARCLEEYPRFQHGVPVTMAKLYWKEPPSFKHRHSFRAPATAGVTTLRVTTVLTPAELAHSFEMVVPDLLWGWLERRRRAIFGDAESKSKVSFTFFAEHIRVEVEGAENRPDLFVVSLALGDWDDY